MTTLFRCASLLAATVLIAGCQTAAPLAASAPAQATPTGPAHAAVPTARPAPAPASALVPVGFRLAQDRTAPGLSALPIGDRTLWVLPQAVLTRSDLAGVAPVQDAEGRAYVRFEFTPTGAQRLAQVSRASRGASLVINVGDTVVAAPRIGDPITQGVLNLPVADTRTAQTIVQAVVARGQ